MPIISILICTLNDRICQAANVLLPPREDICYVVSFQYTDDIFLTMVPDVLHKRTDVTLLPLPQTGLSANRNNALKHCATPLAIIADDDVQYEYEDIDRIIQTFKDHPEVDIACFQGYTKNGEALRSYTDYDFEYSKRPYGTYFSSWEIALRIDLCLPAFDTRFGLGAPYLSCGEEEVFLHQASKYGLHVHYFPIKICTIPDLQTTGRRFFYDKRVRRSKGAVFYMLYSAPMAFLRIFYTAASIKLPDAELMKKIQISPSSSWKLRYTCLKDMLDGFFYVLNHPLNEAVAEETPLDSQ